MLALGLGLGLTITPAPVGGGAPAPASAITLLQVMGPTALDATGDYGDATARTGVNGSGWVAKATMPWLVGQTFDPTKIVLTVQDPGFDEAGSTTVTRTILGGAVLRRQYNAQAQRQMSNDGIQLTVYFSLQSEIYEGSTISAAAALAGYYGSSQAGVINSRVNSSTRAYSKPLWAALNLQHERATGSVFNVEGVAYHRHARNGRQVARVEFIAKDAQGTPNVAATQTASSTSLSAFQTKGQIVEAYKAAIPLANLTQGDLCQVNVKVYPWIGDASAVLDLEVDGFAWPTANPLTPLRFLNDKTGGYGGAHAAVKAGASGGTVQATYALALTTPFPTINAALAALPAWNNTNKGHNDHSGATIWLMEGSLGAGANHSTANSGVAADINTIAAGQCWTDIRVDPAATGRVKMTMAVVRSTADLLRWCVDIDHTAGNGLQGSATPNYTRAAYDGMVLNLSATTATVAVSYRNGLVYARNVSQINIGAAGQACLGRQGGASFRQQYPLLLGCTMADTTTGLQIIPFACIGNSFQRSSFAENAYATIPNHDSADGAIVANNLFPNARATCTWGAAQDITRGFALVQNVIERAVVTSQPALQIGADGQVRPLDNVIVHYNTVPGVDSTGRTNTGYTDDAGSAGVIKREYYRFNLLAEYNRKTDTFTSVTAVTGRVGNWQGRYGVGYEGNVVINGDSSNGGGGAGSGAVNADGANWLGEFWPSSNTLKAGVASIAFLTPRSGVSGTGGGSYRLISDTNAAYGRVPLGRAGLSFDLAGQPRLNDGTGAAGAYELGVIAWPYQFNIDRDFCGFGSSTMAGVNALEKSPLKIMIDEGDAGGATYYTSGEPASGPPVVVNLGAGGTRSDQIETIVSGATAREKAANVIFSLGGNYPTNPIDPVPAIVQDAQDMAAILGHSRFIHIPKHSDNNGDSGGLDWHRLRRLDRELRALYPGRVDDAALLFRDYPASSAIDLDAQSRDEIPLSLANDPAHANRWGNLVLSRGTGYQRWPEALSGGLPFIPHQHVFSSAATNQTNGGIVATLEHDSAIVGTLTGAEVAITNSAHFSAAIEGGAIILRRASATILTDGYYKLYLRVVKGGKSRITILRVYLCDAAPTGASAARINNQGLVREGPIGGVNNTQKLSIAFGIRPLAGWDAEATVKGRQIMLNGGNRTDIMVKQSANMNLGVIFRNAAGGIIYNLDTPTTAAHRFNEANGMQWFFVGVDWINGVYNQAVGANTAQTSGYTLTVGETAALFPAISDNLNLLFTSAVTTAVQRSLNAEVAALAVWNDYIDWTATSGGARDKMRDPTTKRSVLGTTRGGDTPGKINGISPILWMEGGAGNWQSGLNLAAPAERWDCTDRDNLVMTTVAA